MTAIRATLTTLTLFAACASANDWARFRGPDGLGVSPDSAPTAASWSDDENLKWSIDLPGPGLSCPIVVGDSLFLTCWTGYAAGEGSSDDQSDLKRVLLSIDRETGQQNWSREIDAVLPEDRFGGMFAENGYASHTPVSDGQNVYAFFGKSGVVAYDWSGKELWQKRVGDGLDSKSWGSASSPILHENLLIVTAAPESQSLYAFDKQTGEQVWRQEADSLNSMWSTPILVKVNEQRTDLVLAVPYEIWGLNPKNGKLRWHCDGVDSNSACASPIAKDGVVYFVGGRGGGSIAVRAGGKGDVGDSHVLWRGRDRSRIATPVLHDNHLYFLARGVATCIRADDGEPVYQERLTGATASSRRGGGQEYASPVAADGKLYYTTRGGAIHVAALGPEFKQLATNRIASDDGEYSSTPAIVDGRIYLRSTKKLHCIALD